MRPSGAHSHHWGSDGRISCIMPMWLRTIKHKAQNQAKAELHWQPHTAHRHAQVERSQAATWCCALTPADPAPTARCQVPTTEKPLFTQQVSTWWGFSFSPFILWNCTTLVCRKTCFSSVWDTSTYILIMRNSTHTHTHTQILRKVNFLCCDLPHNLKNFKAS